MERGGGEGEEEGTIEGGDRGGQEGGRRWSLKENIKVAKDYSGRTVCNGWNL